MTHQPKIPLVGYTCVVFGTLTQPNATIKQLASGQAGLTLLDSFADFQKKATRKLQVHLRFDLGWEDSINQHIHLLMSVPDRDLERYQSNKSSFDPSYAWRWHQLDWQDYDANNQGDVWSYVVKKHQHLVDLTCPTRKDSCKAGRCPFGHSRNP